MFPKMLPRTTYNPTDEQKQLTNKQVESLIAELQAGTQLFDTPVYKSFREALATPNVIGLDFDNKMGSLYKRIQKWFWNEYGMNFVAQEGKKTDLLERKIQQLREDTLVFTVDVELVDNWHATEGQFGDDKSCYYNGNAVTRRFLNTQPNFRFCKIYKDGKGFGRGIVLTDVGGIKGSALLYNTYPGHDQTKFEDLFATALVHSLHKNTPEKYLSNRVGIENRSEDTSWFYTNTGKGTLIYPAKAAEEAKKATKIALSYGKRPDIAKLEGFKGMCTICTPEKANPRDVERAALFEYDNFVSIKGRRAEAGICKKCESIRKTCHFCKNEGITVSSRIFNSFDGPMVASVIAEGKQVYSCQECFEKIGSLILV